MNQGMGSPLLQLDKLSVGYGGGRKVDRIVASEINLALFAGELVCLLGPNGAGKSTLLRTVAGMQHPLGGQVLLNGQDLHALSKPQLARQLSVVLTERVTAGLLTGYEVIALGRAPHTGWSGSLSARDHAIVQESIDAVGATPLAHRYVSELSDGERQRIMLARALAQEPQIMVLDEITAFLDLPRRVEIMRILSMLAHERQRAILLSTHDLELALSASDRIWLLAPGGAILAGAPEDLVLAGAFASAFAGQGVQFDEEAGSFTIQRMQHSEIGLDGEGMLARWTRRALERRGYGVVLSTGVSGRVRIANRNEKPAWEFSLNGQTGVCPSIESLLAALANARSASRR
jgi:iron complex transport system ATP-binding protein